MEFLLNVSILLAGLAQTAKSIILDATELAFGKDSQSYAAAQALPNEFAFFFVEYGFNAIEMNIREGNTPADIWLDLDLLSKELTRHEVELAGCLVSDRRVMMDVQEAFEKRVNMLDDAPWFKDVMPRLLYMQEHASEVKR